MSLLLPGMAKRMGSVKLQSESLFISEVDWTELKDKRGRNDTCLYSYLMFWLAAAYDPENNLTLLFMTKRPLICLFNLQISAKVTDQQAWLLPDVSWARFQAISQLNNGTPCHSWVFLVISRNLPEPPHL